MRKKYLEPEFDLTKISFESILEENLMDHSNGEVGGYEGGEGLD